MTQQLPNAAAAQIEPAKLHDYCLDPQHPRGRHKARVFRATLGLTRADATWLASAIKAALPQADAVVETTDSFGVRWRADLLLERYGRFALVRTVWQISAQGTAPRLVTCYVLPRNKESNRDA